MGSRPSPAQFRVVYRAARPETTDPETTGVPDPDRSDVVHFGATSGVIGGAMTNILQIFALVYVSAHTEIHPWLRANPQIVDAFAAVESSHRNLSPYDDCGSLAFGWFGFHKNRWQEFCKVKSSFGYAPTEQQVRVLILELDHACKLADKKGIKDYLLACATYHNNGHISKKDTEYVRKIRKTNRGATR